MPEDVVILAQFTAKYGFQRNIDVIRKSALAVIGRLNLVKRSDEDKPEPLALVYVKIGFGPELVPRFLGNKGQCAGRNQGREGAAVARAGHYMRNR